MLVVMNIAITGGTGFLGAALAARLAARQHDVLVLTRAAHPPPAQGRVRYATWTPDGSAGPWARALDGCDGVVNLAGESIARRRWSAAQKTRIRESRLRATGSLCAAIRGGMLQPRVLISGSAIGYYGDRGDEALTEISPPGSDFLATVCRDWEDAARAAADRTRVCTIRTGIVLDRRAGALARMLPPFKLFVGGPLGDGRQYMSWVHKEDWLRLVEHLLTEERGHGPVNATAPAPVTNRQFSRALGHALGRPSLLPAPAFALRLALGEMADALLLASQRVLPVRAADTSFAFRFPALDDALIDVLRRGRNAGALA